MAKIFSDTDLPLLLTTVGLVLVLLILLDRSPILALYPLIAVGWALQIANALIGLAGQAGWFGISQQATSMMGDPLSRGLCSPNCPITLPLLTLT